MKKRKIALSIALASALAFTPVLGACSSDSLSTIDFPRDQNTSYAVTSQGGSAVAYGNYVYFINGTRGYDDSKGESNVWGDVVKGGLYRAELNGESHKKESGDAYAWFEPKLDVAAGLEFAYTESKDYFDNSINVVNVTAIAPKTIGTSGYSNGGIFIYDDYIYYASPNNEQNSVGTIQTTRTNFYMTSLKTGKTVRVYTSSEGVDTTSSAYAFYKYGGAVYLVVNEGSNIVSVKLNTGKQKAEDPVTFEVAATSVYFPVRDTYYNGIDNTTVEDFIYFVRAATDDDLTRTGSVIEAMRPDGSENFVISNNGQTETIEAARDGVFFWRTKNEFNETVLAYDNLSELRYEHSPSYKKAQDELLANNDTKDHADRWIHGEFNTAITSSMLQTYAFRPNDDAQSNEVYFIAATSGKLYKYDTAGNSETLYEGSTGTLLFDHEGYLYYSGSSSDFFRVPMYSNNNSYGNVQLLAEETTSAGISCDYAAGYFTYFAEVDEWANGYTFFSKVDGYEGLEPQFVGKRADADIPTDDQIEEAKK